MGYFAFLLIPIVFILVIVSGLRLLKLNDSKPKRKKILNVVILVNLALFTVSSVSLFEPGPYYLRDYLLLEIWGWLGMIHAVIVIYKHSIHINLTASEDD
jgi:protein-S-isoprenylcysteine O-methyltransferase Ste14